MRFAAFGVILAATLLVSCAKESTPALAPVAAKPAFGTFGVDLAQMDTSVRPGDDFYRYVNGKWLDSTPIPADKSFYGTVVTVFEDTESDLRAIVDELAAGKHAPGSVDQKVADLYASWMNEAGIEARGLEPVKPYLARIAAAKDKADLMKLIGTLDYQAPFGVGGLEMAYTAYQLSLKGQPAPVIDGFTGDQRFFLAFAQVWRGKMRDDMLRQLMLTNPHSPAGARGTFPERNMDAWYEAFDVKAGDKMYLKPEERVHIW